MNLSAIKNRIIYFLCVINPFSFLIKSHSYVIAYFDDLTPSGIADRLRHCLSLYIYCKKFNLRFKIFHKTPFALEEILTPVFDWSMNELNGSSPIRHKIKIYIWSKYKSGDISKNAETKLQYRQLRTSITRKNVEYYVAGNLHLEERYWREAFDELFAPNSFIKKSLEALDLPYSYDAVTLRFQQLLGDFKEGQFEILTASEQEDLMNKSRNKIIQLYEAGYFSNQTILVTSDSLKFLNAIKSLSFVKIINGEMAHPGYSEGKSLEIYAKSFIDLYALRGASSITLLKSDKMYLSGFPEFASIIGHNRFNILPF